MLAEPLVEPSEASLSASLNRWVLHLLSFTVPLYTFAYLITGPHHGYPQLAWLFVVPVVWSLDKHSGPAHHSALVGGSSWPFDAILVGLSLLQFVNVALAVQLVGQAGLLSFSTPVAILLVGVGSAFSAIVVAHELVHRKERGLFLLGRLLLCTVGYEHFSTEHVRGHHARVGTDVDPATARYGESFKRFWRRTVRGQFVSAWRIEGKRLGDEAMSWRDRRILRSRVLHGLVVEVALAILVSVLCGPAAMLFFLAQAYVAVGLLEAVNYFEHYGLRRLEKRVRPIDSWDSDSRFTLFALVGLSRHADHHAHAARPFQSLRTWDESPKLPYGYVVMALMVVFSNRQARRLLEGELRRRQLGPFLSEAPQGTVGSPGPNSSIAPPSSPDSVTLSRSVSPH